MSLENDTQYLRTIGLFSQFNEDQLRMLAFGSDTLRFPMNTEIFRDGQPADGGYYVIEGEVQLNPVGGKATQVILGPGDLIGEMAMVTRNKRIGDAIAKSDCKLLRISRSTLLRMLEEYPELAAGMRDKIADNIRDFTSQLSSVDARLKQ